MPACLLQKTEKAINQLKKESKQELDNVCICTRNPGAAWSIGGY